MKKRIFRVLAMALAVVMMLAVFASCAKEDVTNGGETKGSETTGQKTNDPENNDPENNDPENNEQEKPTHEHKYKNGECLICNEKTPYVLTEDILVGLSVESNSNYYYWDTTGKSYPAMISVTAPNEFLGGKSLSELVNENKDGVYDTSRWQLILDMTNEDGYAPLELNTYTWLESLYKLDGNKDLYDVAQFAQIIVYYDIDNHTHKYSDTPKALSCANTDTARVCMICHKAYVENAPEHTYSNGKCTVCGASEADVWDGSVAIKYGGGEGTETSPYLISNAEQLALLASEINNGGGNQSPSKYFKLTADIDLNGQEWDPIGSCRSAPYSIGDLKCAFTYHFDGDGHVVSNFKITTPAQDYYTYFGLFGYVSHGSIKNLGVTDFVIDIATGNQYDIYTLYVGGLAGCVGSANVSNCYTNGLVSGYNNRFDTVKSNIYVGGLVGSFGSRENTLTDSYSLSNVIAKSTYYVYAGGLCGESYGTVSNCYATGDVLAVYEYNTRNFETVYRPTVRAGGLTACSYGTVSNCYALGSVTSESEYYSSSVLGGLVGRVGNQTEISNCYAKGDVRGTHLFSNVGGGLIGEATMDEVYVKDCHASGGVYMNSNRSNTSSNASYAGGLIGDLNYATVERCYAEGDVHSEGYNYGANAGGLFGRACYTQNISDCYATGSVWSNDYGGGLAGCISDVTITNCYSSGLVLDGNGCGGLIGYTPSAYQSIFINCFTASNVNADCYVGRFIQDDYDSAIDNCYVYDGQILAIYPNIIEPDEEYAEYGKCSAEQLGSASFYTDTLHWDSSIWDLSSLNAEERELPKLKAPL